MMVATTRSITSVIRPAQHQNVTPSEGFVMPAHFRFLAIALLFPLCAPLMAQQQFSFRDVTKEVGLLPDVGGIAGHAAAWGDIDGSGFPSLFVGSFGGKPYDAKPAMLFRNVK